MAQDVRPYKSKEQDGQGNEIILRDQQLVEQTSQTTMASGEYFEIVDVDGRMAKIPKDNMIGVVREALGTLLNGLADQTTVAKFLTLNGNTLGASAAATAASVLGGSVPVFYGSKGVENGMPVNYGLYYKLHDGVNYRFDYYVSLGTNNIPEKYWIRWYGSNGDISSWMMMPLYPSLSDLASALGGLQRKPTNSVTSLNVDQFNDGIVSHGGDLGNGCNYGVLIAYSDSSGYGIQIDFGSASAKWRLYVANNWKTWQDL